MSFQQKTQRWIKKLGHYANRWWYGPLLAFLSALDAYVVMIPNDALVIAAALSRPKKWLSLTIWMTVGSAIGAVSVAALMSYGGEWILRHFLSEKLLHSHSWTTSVEVIRQNGLWGLALVSFSPLPQHAAVIIAGLAKMRLTHVFLAVLIGRGLKYGIFAYLAAKAPKTLKKWHLL